MNNILELKRIKSLYKDKKLSLNIINNYINNKKNLQELEVLHPFLINEIFKIHANEFSIKNTEILKNTVNTGDALDKCDDRRYGNKIYSLTDNNTIYYVFGDIHGDSITPIRFLKKINFINKVQNGENIRLIFLGDYIDRGLEQYKTMELILILKYIFTKNVFLLRGNHDGGCIIDNNYKLCVGRNKNTTDKDYFVANTYNLLIKNKMSLKLLHSYLNFFNSLCHILLLKSGDKNYICVHGGIPRHQNENFNFLISLADLSNTNIIDSHKGNIIHNILWSDPTENINDYRDSRRFYFYKNNFDSFKHRFNIDYLIRGHEAYEEGYKEFFEKSLFTVFSSGLCDVENNETAYNDITPCVLEINNDIKKIIRL